MYHVENPLLVEWYEKGYRRVRGSVPYVPMGENRASETWRFTTTLANSRVEMRTHRHGFHDWNTKNHQTA